MSPLVALDLDGTLVDARERQVRLAAAILEQRGLAAVDPDELWALKREGAGTAAALRQLGLPEAAAAEFQHEWTGRVEERRWLELNAPLPGAAEAVAAMRSDGAKLFVLTARRDRANATWEVSRLGLGLDDLEVVDPSNAAAAKADVLGRRGAAGMIGDAESDAAAAAAASIPFVAVSSGQRSESFLRGAGVELVVADLGAAWAELRALLR